MKHPLPHPASPRFTPDQVASLTAVAEPWLSCDDCFTDLDNCIDVLLDGTGPIDEPLRVHLARCAACLEEAETLLTLAAEDRGLHTEHSLDHLRALLDPDQAVPAEPAPRRANRTWRRRLRRQS